MAIEDNSSYLAEEYIGNKPEPFNLYSVLGITEDEPMFYTSEDNNETLHFKVYYYKSELWIDISEEEPTYHFRGPFAGVSAFHLVIEKIENEWKAVYVGLG